MSIESVNSAVSRIVLDAGRPLSTSEVIEAAADHFAPSTVRAALRALVDTGNLEKPRHGYYAAAKNSNTHDPEPSDGWDAQGLAVSIPLVSMHAGGDGAVSWEREIALYMMLRDRVTRRETGVDPETLVALVAVGSDMAPTINAGDRVLASLCEGEPIVSGAVYYLRSRSGSIVCLRAHVNQDGSVTLANDTGDVFGNVYPEDDTWRPVARVVRVEKPV